MKKTGEKDDGSDKGDITGVDVSGGDPDRGGSNELSNNDWVDTVSEDQVVIQEETYDGKEGRVKLRKIAWANVKKLLDENDPVMTKMVLTDVFWPGGDKAVGRPKRAKAEEEAIHDMLVKEDEMDKPIR